MGYFAPPSREGDPTHGCYMYYCPNLEIHDLNTIDQIWTKAAVVAGSRGWRLSEEVK